MIFVNLGAAVAQRRFLFGLKILDINIETGIIITVTTGYKNIANKYHLMSSSGMVKDNIVFI